MKFLNLDNQFEPFGKSIEFEHFTFTGGEPHIKIKAPVTTNDKVTITTRIRQFNDVGLVLLAADALRRMGVEKLHLLLPYFPAARQDRVAVTGEALSVKVYADVLNSAGFDSITILDPHSEVTPALLENVRVANNHQFVAQCLEGITDYALISPDGGALKKAYRLAQFLGTQQVVECSKHRDVKTGNLSGFAAYTDDLQGKTCVIVDDICDGGGTFLGLADELKRKNAGDIYLIVTHGIFSNGFDKLGQTFKKIYSTNSFSTIQNEALIQVPITSFVARCFQPVPHQERT